MDSRRIFEYARRRELPLGGMYIVDVERIRRWINELVELCARLPVQPIFPVKTFPHAGVLELLSAAGFGFDVSNRAEFELVGEFDDTFTLVNGPLAGANGWDYPFTRGLLPLASTLDQVEALAQSHAQAVGFRIDSVDLLGPGRGIERSKFGLDVEQIPDALARARDGGHQVRYFHAHHGNDQMRPSDYRELLCALLEVAERNRVELDAVNIGGGQAACRQQALPELLEDLCSLLPEHTELHLEGGALHFEDAVFLAAPIAEVQRGQQGCDVTLGVCLGAALAWSAPSVYFPYSSPAAHLGRVHLLGGSCAEGDYFGAVEFCARSPRVCELEEGMPVVFTHVSPYAIGRSFSFNGIPAPELEFLA